MSPGSPVPGPGHLVSGSNLLPQVFLRALWLFFCIWNSTKKKNLKSDQRAFLEKSDGYKIFKNAVYCKCGYCRLVASRPRYATALLYYAVAPVGVATTYSQHTFTSMPTCSSFNITFCIYWLEESGWEVSIDQLTFSKPYKVTISCNHEKVRTDEL